MAWDRCNQDSVWTELECAALVGEDQPLCPDLPELDLSELDVSDLDADSFLGGFKWYSDQSEVISSQYGNEAANLFEKIDEENEANLLAVLTETLDSIPVDEDGLPSFEALADGDVTNTSEQSCPSTPDGSPPAQEAEEPSLLKKLLLAPTNSQLDYGQYPGSKAQGHAAGGQRLRPPPGVAKTENPWNGKQRSSIPQQNRPVRRPCTELLKYLTASDEVLRTKASQKRGGRTGSGSGNSGKDKAGGASSSSSSPSSSSTSSFSSLSSSCSSSSSKTKPPPAPVPSLPPRQPSHPQRGDLEPSVTQEPHLHTQALCRHPGDQVLPLLAKPTILPLPLTPESPNDHKGSPFENKTIERTLSVELSGTAGLTPPTTPPHKTSQENPFKPSMKTKLPSCPSSAVGSKRARLCDNTPHPATAGTVALEGAEHGELYAQLSKASAPSAKRGAPRAMGDHDYCQSTGTSAGRDVSLCSRPAGPERRCAECAESGQPSLPPSSSSSSSSSSLAGQSGNGSESETALGRRDTPEDQPAPARQPSSTARKPLLDQEIRAELNRHFGPPQRAVSVDVESDRPHPPEDIGAWDDYLPPGLPLEDSEDERELLLCPWETSPLDLLFESSPSCSPYSCSPSRGSVSPPAVSPQRFHWPRSRSTSHRRQPSPCPRSRSPYSHSGSRSRHHADTGTCKSRTQRSPQTQSRPRCDSYEEHQHACLRRDDHRRDHEHCESDRVQQWEGQRKKAVEERRTLCVGRLRPDGGRAELRRRFEVFGEIEECVVSLRDDGDTFGFITYRYSCDAFTALENGHTLLQPNEPPFELCFGGRKQFCRSSYTELESHCDDFDPASAKSKYDSMDFDSLLREAQRSLKR
ncbi:peroxisome proliferator-activated receptor gamma coactivator 1-alpha isoform X4 [Brienomyrus brachyistius]|uniref:peroxisome proliferator-activated receptor gamma coactivator 1-alpha isoform X4 n=1 Tax=Brienomyrus brachyistius TaxID=42636 RepID=UPI0020B2DB02|nr:peroxisome proliferator-activated receptor gamma coactivator 1-alpha isoform X4 [Brienomyrus brachyistius]